MNRDGDEMLEISARVWEWKRGTLGDEPSDARPCVRASCVFPALGLL